MSLIVINKRVIHVQSTALCHILQLLIIIAASTGSFFICTVSAKLTIGEEGRALSKWKASLDNQSQSLLSSWVGSNPCNHSWLGISCNNRYNNGITDIEIANYGSGFKGTLINFNFSSFPNLQSLKLNNNSLSGSIPSNIDALSQLTFLDLSYNKLFGYIPPQIGNLTRLTWLSLNNNIFSGGIPKTIGALVNLVEIFLHDNELSSIPLQVGNLTNANRLFLLSNNLSGRIPEEIGLMTSLSELDLSDNLLNGSIPSSMGNLTKIIYIFLSGNELSGSIPQELGKTPLQMLQVSENNLTGTIPPSLGNLTDLKSLFLNFNLFVGSIPPELNKLTKLVSFQLSGNSFVGQLPQEFCHEGVLQNFSTYENHFTGPIPKCLQNCTSLVRVRLDDNRLSGDVSESFGFHPQLDYIDLSHNSLEGQLSPKFGQCKSLTSLKFSNNRISGTIPPEIGNATQLRELHLYSNQLLVHIPEQLGNLKKLLELRLDDNILTGTVPSSLGKLSELSTLNLAINHINGAIPIDIQDCSGLIILNLSHNSLSGSIPEEVGKLRILEELDFSRNALTGHIPSEIGGLQRLTTLNLSHNKLNGSIPSSNLAELSSLLSIDISNNQLQGCLPNTRAFQVATIDAVKNNKELHGEVTGLSRCPSDGQNLGGKKTNKTLILVLVVTLGCPFLLILIIGISYSSRHGCKSEEDRLILEAQGGGNLFAIWSYDGKMVYETILDATEGFDPKYRIGTGGQAEVYKAKLPTGEFVAVKKFRASTQDGLTQTKALRSEIHALTNIRHRSIVKLYGFCSHPRHSFLVYQFLEGGSLYNRLNRNEEAAKFEWSERINAIKDVACALSYLHHDCTPAIVHRDISSKNVLLDEDCNAHISDFGSARFLFPNSSSLTSFGGTYGYAAPELAYQLKATTESDVYSFGTLMLEVIMGKHPRDMLSCLQSSASSSRIMVSETPIMDLFDQRISLPRGLEEHVIVIFKLAFSCLHVNSKLRPTMRQITGALSTEASTPKKPTVFLTLEELVRIDSLVS